MILQMKQKPKFWKPGPFNINMNYRLDFFGSPDIGSYVMMKTQVILSALCLPDYAIPCGLSTLSKFRGPLS